MIEEQKEEQWLLEKVGYISASHADSLVSKSGKWIEGNIDYLYDIQDQRTTGEPAPQISARPMKIGTQEEPNAIIWLRENCPDLNILHCDKDFDVKVFEKPWKNVMFGVSPDAFVMKAPCKLDIAEDGKIKYNPLVVSQIERIIEIKCVVGRKSTTRYFSPTLPAEVKREMAKDEHKWQMAAQLLAYPLVEKITLLKYRPQMDENPYDMRPIDDPARGICFEFTRADLFVEMAILEPRIRYADAYLKSGKDLEKINELKIEIPKQEEE